MSETCPGVTSSLMGVKQNETVMVDEVEEEEEEEVVEKVNVGKIGSKKTFKTDYST